MLYLQRPRILRRLAAFLTALFLMCGSLAASDPTENAAEATPESASSVAGLPDDRPTILVVVGAAGTEEYASIFAEWAERWREAAEQAEAEFHRVGANDERDAGDAGENEKENAAEGRSGGESDRDQLISQVSHLSKHESLEPLWILLLGHGTYDGKTAKFNLRGPDISAEELRAALADAKRPQIVINCSSSSGPFVNVLSDPQRTIVTATRSGHELNYARFGGYMAEAISNPAADLDKDDQVSLLEAFLFASGKVAQFYADENRLATEHAILDDNGDGLGTPADFFRGVRAVRGARDGAKPDGARARRIHLIRSSSEQALSAEQRQRRDKLEQQLEALRESKSQRSADDYFDELEPILVELAKIYE